MKKQLILIVLALAAMSIGAIFLSHTFLSRTSEVANAAAPTGYIEAELRDVEIIGPGRGVVYLAEKGGISVLPIYISEEQALAITLLENGADTQRPMMYDLLGRVLDNSNLKLEYISVDRLEGGIYYATIVLQNGKSVAIDARPSDSIIIALTKNAPIYLSEKLLNSEGVSMHPPVDDLRGSVAI